MNNKLLNIWWLIAGVLLILGVSACEEDSVVQGELPRLFRPIGIDVDVSSVEVLISWSRVDSAKGYEVEIYQDSLEFKPENLIVSQIVESNNFKYELAGDTRFSVLVTALAQNSGENSFSNKTYSFETPAENIFEGFDSYLIGKGAVEIAWEPAKNVTALKFIPEVGDPIIKEVASEEKKIGVKTCSDLPNEKYKVEILNEDVVRGELDILVEGDLFLSSGGDLSTALSSVRAGGTIVLDANGTYSFVGDLEVTKSMKIRGMNIRDKAKIFVTDGNHMFSFASSITESDFFILENLDICGIKNDLDAEDSGAERIRGVFDQSDSSPLDIGTIKIANSYVHNFGRQVIRLRGYFTMANMVDGVILPGQKVKNFVIDNCIINDIANVDEYAVIYSNKSLGAIYNIKIINSTIYDTKTMIIRYQESKLESLVIDNCFFNDFSSNPDRGFIDLNNTVSIGDGISLINSVIGSTAVGSRGIKKGDDVVLVVENCFATSDFDQSGDPLKEIPDLINYEGVSTELWNDPLNGDFTYNDNTFIGSGIVGDLKWIK